MREETDFLAWKLAGSIWANAHKEYYRLCFYCIYDFIIIIFGDLISFFYLFYLLSIKKKIWSVFANNFIFQLNLDLLIYAITKHASKRVLYV